METPVLPMADPRHAEPWRSPLSSWLLLGQLRGSSASLPRQRAANSPGAAPAPGSASSSCSAATTMGMAWGEEEKVRNFSLWVQSSSSAPARD